MLTCTNNIPCHMQPQAAQCLRLCTADVAGELCGCLWCCNLQRPAPATTLQKTWFSRAWSPDSDYMIAEEAYSAA